MGSRGRKSTRYPFGAGDANAYALSIPVRLFPTGSREPAARREGRDKCRVTSRQHEPRVPFSVLLGPPRSAPDTPPLRISAKVLGRMKEYYLLAAGRSGR